jgi:predicted anti-sigma-YlaC factor YlaD
MATDREVGHTECEKHEVLLEDYLNGELSAADVGPSMEHVQKCSGCRSALERAATSARLLRLTEAWPDPGPGFVRTVMARVRTAENERVALRANFWQPFVSFGWRFAATATLAVVGLVSYNVGWGHRAQPNVVSARPTIDIFAPEPARVPANGDEVLMMVADNGHEKH